MELNTYGDLRAAIKAISRGQRKEKIGNVTLGFLVGLLPGGDTAKTTFDFVRAAFSKPDDKKSKTWIDKIDVDDEFSAIVDDTVENAFLKTISAAIDSKPDNTPLEDDFNMNQQLVNYLREKFSGRTVTGIKESNNYNKNKMKNQSLKNVIKEEIKKILSEEEAQMKTGAALARDLRQTALDLTKDTGGFTSMEASGVDMLINKILDKAKNGNLNPMVIKQINVILDRIKSNQ